MPDKTVDELLEESNYEKHTAARFPTPGTKVVGTITRMPRVVTTRDEVKGKDIENIVVELETGERDENGDTIRTLWVKPGYMRSALADAVKKAGRKLEVGGKLAMRYTGDDMNVPPKMGNRPKKYAAQYEPPAVAADGDTDLF